MDVLSKANTQRHTLLKSKVADGEALSAGQLRELAKYERVATAAKKKPILAAGVFKTQKDAADHAGVSPPTTVK